MVFIETAYNEEIKMSFDKREGASPADRLCGDGSIVPALCLEQQATSAGPAEGLRRQRGPLRSAVLNRMLRNLAAQLLLALSFLDMRHTQPVLALS